MWMVVTSLTPAAAAGVVLFGRPALVVIVSSNPGRRLCRGFLPVGYGPPDYSWRWERRGYRPAFGFDPSPGTALVDDGLRRGLAIIIGKQVFGGLGHNLSTPPWPGGPSCWLRGRGAMMTWKWPAASLSWAGESVDAIGGATVLGWHRQGFFAKHGVAVPYSQLLWGISPVRSGRPRL